MKKILDVCCGGRIIEILVNKANKINKGDKENVQYNDAKDYKSSN